MQLMALRGPTALSNTTSGLGAERTLTRSIGLPLCPPVGGASIFWSHNKKVGFAGALGQLFDLAVLDANLPA